MKKLLLLLIIPMSAWAWQPQQPIQVNYAIGPGSGNEQAFNTVGQTIERQGLAKFIPQYTPGADGVVGTNEFVRQPNNGYHVQVISIDSAFIISELYNKSVVKYTLDDFTPVMAIGHSPFVLIANNDVPVNNITEFVDYFRKDSRKVSIGIGTSGKIPGNMLFDAIGLADHQAQLVSYKSGSQAALDVAGGHIPFALLSAPIAYQLYKDGRVKYIAQTGRTKLAQINSVSLACAALPKMVYENTWGLMLPKDTAPDVVAWYQTVFARQLISQEARERRQELLIDLDKNMLTPSAWRREIIRQQNLYLNQR
jgi:tripartite-type tricarboxylate transporter receptor subunit TctC